MLAIFRPSALCEHTIKCSLMFSSPPCGLTVKCPPDVLSGNACEIYCVRKFEPDYRLTGNEENERSVKKKEPVTRFLYI